jgi:hypothetical protein
VAGPLVLIKWEDSAQPIPGWNFLSDLPQAAAVRCVSVGWLVHDGDVRILAPNLGERMSEQNLKLSGSRIASA